MRYKAKNVAALQTLLSSWPDQMRVEVDPDIGVSARTVGELRKLTAWPENSGHNDAAPTRSRERYEGEQGQHDNTHVAETVRKPR